MRIILYLWATPMLLFWGWYALSFYDLNFGTIFLSRQLHDLILEVYGQTLGVPPSQIPPMLAWACTVDTALVGGIIALRWRKLWYPQTHAFMMSRFQPIAARWLPNAGKRPDDAAMMADARGANVLPDGPAHPAE